MKVLKNTEVNKVQGGGWISTAAKVVVRANPYVGAALSAYTLASFAKGVYDGYKGN